MTVVVLMRAIVRPRGAPHIGRKVPTGAARALLPRGGHLPRRGKGRRARGKSATALVLARLARGCRGGERAVLGAGLEDPEGRIYGGVVRSIFVNPGAQVVTVWRPIHGRLAAPPRWGGLSSERVR